MEPMSKHAARRVRVGKDMQRVCNACRNRIRQQRALAERLEARAAAIIATQEGTDGAR
jgi:hypothetical protein